MKELFVNNLSGILMEEKGFYVIKTPFIPFMVSDYTLAKDEWGALNLVSFIDMEHPQLLNEQSLCDIFNNEIQFFKERVNNIPVIYFKIFLTENSLSQSFIDSALGCYSHSLIKKTTLVPIIVDIGNKKIYSNPQAESHSMYIINKLYDTLGAFSRNNNYFNLDEKQDKVKKNREIDIQNSDSKVSKPYVTYALMIINIVMFIIMELAGGTQNPYVLTYFGIKINELVSNGQYWRLLTSAFIHIGYAHIAFNMYGLYNIGSLTESIYGRKKYLFVYMLSALWGSISSFFFSPYASAGASGAIFGLFGSLLYIGQKKPRIFFTSFGVNILVVLGFNLLYGFSSTGIDNFAHMGGLVGGYLASNAAGVKNESKSVFFRLSILLLCVIPPLAALVLKK